MKQHFFILFMVLTTLSCSNTGQEKEDPINKQLQKTVAEVNATLPIFVDEYTRLDSMALGHSKNILYYYTLVGLDLDSIVAADDSVTMDDFKNAMTEALKENVVTSPELQYYRDNQATLNYVYYNEKKKELMRISFGPDSYKN